jgi:hypothetical protein
MQIEDEEPATGTISDTVNKRTSAASAISGVMAHIRYEANAAATTATTSACGGINDGPHLFNDEKNAITHKPKNQIKFRLHH